MLLALIYLGSVILALLVLRHGKKYDIKDSRKLPYYICFIPGWNTFMVIIACLSAIHALGDWIENQ